VVSGLAKPEISKCERAGDSWIGRTGSADGMPTRWLDNAECNGWGAWRNNDRGHDGQQFGATGNNCRPGPVNGQWADADWLFCRDGRFRPVEPGTFPLAHGAACRVGRLRGYGNAINAEQAIEFIRAFMAV